MLDIPVLRQADGTGISPDKAWQHDSFQLRLKTLGQAAGFVDNVSIYCERRETGNLLNGM
jgi:hypothetical protein